MKKVLLLLLVLCTSVANAYDFEVGGIYYNITSASQMTVEVTYESREWGWSEYYYRCKYQGDIVIPENVSWNGSTYTVTRIGDHAFATNNSSSFSMYFNNLKSITMPETIQSIGELAFWACYGLTVVRIPASVTSIENNAFAGCNNVIAYFLQSAVPPISYFGLNVSAFGYSSTNEIVVPQKALYEADPEWSQYGSRLVEVVTFDKQPIVYDGSEHILGWTNNMVSYSVELTGNNTSSSSGSNTMRIHLKCYRNEDIFIECDFDYLYEVLKAPLYAHINDANRLYGDDNPDFDYTLSGFVNGENESVITTMPIAKTDATNTSSVGQYPIYLTGEIIDNYELVYEPGMLIVSKAPLSAKVNDTSKRYGAYNPSFSIEYFGLKNGESEPSWITRPSFSTEATKSTPVGQYDVYAINGNPVNYEMSEIEKGILTITPATLKIKVANATRQYYNNNPQFSFSCSGFVNGDGISSLSPQPQLSTIADITSPVGEYVIEAHGAENPNYDIEYEFGTLKVTQRTLQALAANCERPYKTPNPEFIVEYQGFVGNDNEDVLISKPIASTVANINSNVGNYRIDVTGGEALNYLFSYTSGTLTITKAEQQIEWNQDLSNLHVGDQVELKAIASSELPITYTVDDGNIAEIYTSGSKTFLDCISEGQVQILAIQNGNDNYYPSQRIRKTVNISDSSSYVAVSSIILNKTSCELFGIGDELTLVATILPENATNKDVNWMSSNESICTVENGTIIAMDYGTCVIIASSVDGNHIALCNVSVVQKTDLPGDVNNDGEINIADINAIINIILGSHVDDGTFTRADVNGDGEVNIADINAIINKILG